MQIVDNQVSDIVESYVWVQTAENELLSKWRKPLLDIYAQQRARYEQDAESFVTRKSDFSRKLRVGIWMSSILVLLGILVLPGLLLINEIGDFRGPLFCFSPLLILGGLTGWAIIIILWIWQREHVKPPPPQNPLKLGLVNPLLPIWKQSLIGTLPDKKPHPNASGEYHFISRLLSLEDDAYILYGLQFGPGTNTDIIVVGSKGIWVFEVIFLKGLIRWEDGKWSQIQTNRKFITSKQHEVQALEVVFEDQWQKSADLVSETINTLPQDLLNRSPSITQVRGGLVFSYPKGRYDIPPGCPFNWGVVPFWLEKFESLPQLDDMDDYTIFSVVEILLKRYQKVLQIEQPRSMLKQSETIVHAAEEHIQSWINANTLKRASNT